MGYKSKKYREQYGMQKNKKINPCQLCKQTNKFYPDGYKKCFDCNNCNLCKDCYIRFEDLSKKIYENHFLTCKTCITDFNNFCKDCKDTAKYGRYYCDYETIFEYLDCNKIICNCLEFDQTKCRRESHQNAKNQLNINWTLYASIIQRTPCSNYHSTYCQQCFKKEHKCEPNEQNSYIVI